MFQFLVDREARKGRDITGEIGHIGKIEIDMWMGY
jgi:hypothetical protein